MLLIQPKMLNIDPGLRVGLTYDLKSEHLESGASEEEVAEFEDHETIISLGQTLTQLGFRVDYIGNIFALVGRLANGHRWDFVFNIAEGVHGLARETQIPCLLDAYQIPYVFSESSTLCVSLNKAICKQIVIASAVPTADFFVVTALEDLEGCHLKFPLFLKPVAEGTGKGISSKSKVTHRDDLWEQCSFLLKRFQQPVLIETYLSGAEYTVGIVGTGKVAQVVGVMEVQFTDNTDHKFYSFINKKEFKKRVTYNLASKEIEKSVGNVALEAWRSLKCRDGGRIDIRLDDKGIPNFIEVNPLPGLNPEFSDLVILARLNGKSYAELLKNIVNSTLKREFPKLLSGLHDSQQQQVGEQAPAFDLTAIRPPADLITRGIS